MKSDWKRPKVTAKFEPEDNLLRCVELFTSKSLTSHLLLLKWVDMINRTWTTSTLSLKFDDQSHVYLNIIHPQILSSLWEEKKIGQEVLQMKLLAGNKWAFKQTHSELSKLMSNLT